MEGSFNRPRVEFGGGETEGIFPSFEIALVPFARRRFTCYLINHRGRNERVKTFIFPYNFERLFFVNSKTVVVSSKNFDSKYFSQRRDGESLPS